jgi:hypothetical protein
VEQEGEAVILLAGWLDAAWCLVALVAIVGAILGFSRVLDELDKIRKGGGK